MKTIAAVAAAILLTAAPSFAQSTLILDSAQLAKSKAAIAAGDAKMKAALADLEQRATKLLSKKPASVMDKGITPPSGDKHDYMSQAPYWWADPTKPNGLPYIRKDGETNPEIKKLSDHDNIGALNNDINTLGLAYYFTGNDKYAAKARELAYVWFVNPDTRMNPNLKFGQGIPGITQGRGIGLIETRDFPMLMDGILLMKGSKSWSEADVAKIQNWMSQFGRWMVESTEGQEEAKNGNNHETWYHVQLASILLFTGDRDGAKKVLEQTRESVAKQIEPDGKMPRELERTRAFHYSIFNLEAFFHAADLGRQVGVDIWNYRTPDGRGLRAALDFLLPFATGEKKFPYDQITPWEGSDLSEALRRGAAAWHEPTYRQIAEKLGGKDSRLDLIIP